MPTSLRSTSLRQKCVWAGEQNWRWTRPITWGSSWSPPTVPSQHSEHRHQHRSLFIHPVRAPSQTGERGGWGRTGKDRADQIVSVLRLLLHMRNQKKKTIIVAKGREKAGRESAVYKPLRESLVVGTIGVNGTQGWDWKGGAGFGGGSLCQNHADAVPSQGASFIRPN